MIKQEVRSLIRNLLPRIDKVGRWHDIVISAAVEKAISQMYEEVWRINPLNLQRYTVGFGYVTPVTVNTEVNTNIKYSTLPESIIPFQDKASGVRRISTVAQGSFTFFPMDFREMDLIPSGGYFKTVNSKVGYAVNQTRVEFYNLSAAIEVVGVRMDLIIPFSKYDDDDEVKIPEIGDMRTGETFVDRVMKILGIIQPVDIIDDNAPQKSVGQKDN